MLLAAPGAPWADPSYVTHIKYHIHFVSSIAWINLQFIATLLQPPGKPPATSASPAMPNGFIVENLNSRLFHIIQHSYHMAHFSHCSAPRIGFARRPKNFLFAPQPTPCRISLTVAWRKVLALCRRHGIFASEKASVFVRIVAFHGAVCVCGAQKAIDQPSTSAYTARTTQLPFS